MTDQRSPDRETTVAARVLYTVRRRFQVEALVETATTYGYGPDEVRVLEKWEPVERVATYDEAYSFAHRLITDHEGARIVDLYPPQDVPGD